MAELIGKEEFSDYGKHRQVYLATHDGEGNRLPFVNRAYISFSYGGIPIEDFNLLATMGDRLNKNLYADFEDTTTNYDTVDGQYYWGTRSSNNQLDFVLSTDGMTQNELEKFKQYFRPGIERELILAEHPNRAIKARVSAVPSISMIPFETIEELKINNKIYEVKTALYRGDINISFVMDEPYWYSKLFYMPRYVELENLNNNSEVTKGENMVEALDNIDCLKICLEDYLPYSQYLPARTFLGDSHYVADDNSAAPRVGKAIVGTAILGITITDNIGSQLGPNSDTPWYVFYCGTAPSKPIIKFSCEMSFDDEGYIIFPSRREEGYIMVGQHEFRYALPSLYVGFNKVIEIINTNESTSLIDIRNSFRDEVKEKYSRERAISLIDEIILNDQNLNKENFINNMKALFINNLPKGTFQFDSSTGESIGTFMLNLSSSQEINQNVGDMVRSNYIIIDERSNFFPGKQIEPEDCLLITSSEDITDFLILFKNMYL